MSSYSSICTKLKCIYSSVWVTLHTFTDKEWGNVLTNCQGASRLKTLKDLNTFTPIHIWPQICMRGSLLALLASFTRIYPSKEQLFSSRREEELRYLEFVTDVTNDVLNRGIYTNSVLKQVFQSHVEKNKGRLDEVSVLCCIVSYHQLRARRALKMSKDVPFRTRDVQRYEPEGRHCCAKSMAIAPFWFSTEHLWTVLTSFWLAADDIHLALHWSRVMLLLLLLLMIWQSPGLPGWRKVNFITVTRRPHHPNIAACCLATSPGFLPTLCEKWSGFFYVHRVFLSYTRDRRLKVSSKRLGNEDKAPCPRALLPGRGLNWGPPVWKSEALTARPRQLLYYIAQCSITFWFHSRLAAMFKLRINHHKSS